MNAALIAGVGLNLFLWLVIGDQLFWFWWNLIGAAVTLGVAYLVSLVDQTDRETEPLKGVSKEETNRKYLLMLGLAFVAMVLISLSIKFWF